MQLVEIKGAQINS